MRISNIFPKAAALFASYVSLSVFCFCQETKQKVQNEAGKPAIPFRMDFSFPTYEGVEEGGSMDLQVLSSGLVIIGNDYTLPARKRARESRIEKLTAVEKQGGNKWVIQKQVDAIMREAFIETYTEYEKLDRVDFFSLISGDDPAYKQERRPTKVTRFCHSRGNFREFHIANDRVQTSGNYLGNFSYVFLPEPLKSGSAYTISQSDGRKTTFLYDEDQTVSRAIKVNQTGYLPSVSRKYAYLGAWQAGIGSVDFSKWNDKPFEVVNADSREVVHTGTIKLLAQNPKNHLHKKEHLSAGEDIYEMDLSGLKAEGDFYIRIRGIGRSWPFHHGQEAYGRAFYIHLRGLFHQRGGHELKREHTGWPRPMAHEKAYLADYVPSIPYYKTPVQTFPAILRFEKQNPDAPEWRPPHFRIGRRWSGWLVRRS
jgi:Cellulase N-terminal ig-like domain